MQEYIPASLDESSINNLVKDCLNTMKYLLLEGAEFLLGLMIQAGVMDVIEELYGFDKTYTREA